ncbi:structure-specific endonuclease subunit EME2 isoform X2 [Tenrec ecaudatus]|uniref:structure-specific endonuclease subunit EME2 isoform X2 n=1 Tax=Tenrec ecaudatus TaxID=94439 RepID=UPI003F5AA892
MAKAGATGSSGSRGGGRGRGQRRTPTWEISDSDTEGPMRSVAAVKVPEPKEERRATAEALRPEQALRRLVVRVDPAVLEDTGSDVLLEALGALGCDHRIEPQPHARSLSWSRLKPDPCPGGVPLEVWASHEQELLLLVHPEDFLQGVAQLTQLSEPACTVPWMCPQSATRPHLAVIGLEAHLCVQGGQWPPERPAGPRAEWTVGWPQVEEALVLLQLGAGLDVLLAASWQELSEHVCAVTRALAQRPYKQLREAQAFSFCTAGRWAAGERVARDGRGLRGTWCRQIQQFNRVSPTVANAVVTAFPSPRLLQQVRHPHPDTQMEILAPTPLTCIPTLGICSLQLRPGAAGPTGGPSCGAGPGWAAPQGGTRPLKTPLPLPDHIQSRPSAGPGLLSALAWAVHST